MNTPSGFRLSAGCVLAIVLTAAPLFAAEAPIPEVVYPDFWNGLINGTNNPAAHVSSSVAFFSGTVGAYAPAGSGIEPEVPKAAGSGLALIASAFGETFAPRPSQKDLDRFVTEAQRLLYPQLTGGTSRELVAGSATAFRYKYLLYAPGDGIRVDLARFSSWYGEAEREQAVEAIAILRSVLQQDPLSIKARNALLDAYYDLAVAEVQSIKMSQGALAEYRLGFKLPPPGGFVIDEEITLHQAMTEQYEFVLAKYGELLNDRMGVNTSTVDATAPPGIPLGAYVFQREQPVRSQNASQFVDGDGVLKTVPDYDPDTGTSDPSDAPRPLFAAYKDYVTVLSIFRDYARTAGDLARLYAMRGRQGTRPADNDLDQAYLLINRVQQDIQTTLVLLEGLFPGFEPAPNDASGLAVARNGVQVGLADLSHVRSFLDGKANLLGFDPDFLVLIQEFPDSTQGNQFDSYDALVRWIRNTGTSPLNYAETTFERAFANYEKYQGFADQVDKELSAINDTYADRYTEITGFTPDEAGDHLNKPREGSELWEVNLNIQHANIAVTNLVELTEMGKQHAADAANTTLTASNRVDKIDRQYTSYKDTITEQRDIITTWSAIQAGVQASYDMLVDGLDVGLAGGPAAWVSWGVVGAANIAAQTYGEVAKGEAQEQLDLASAEWEFTTEMADAELVVAQAQDSQNDLARERMSIALQTSDARKIQAQETGRKANLIREVQRIRQARDEGKTGVSGRYYADPIHFLRAQNDMIVADLAFNEAQRWAFFTVRALEFKWNKNFLMNYLGKDWETSTLFKLRNYRELEQMIGAMEQFNTVNLVGFNREPFVDRVSLRDDVLARYPGPGTDDGWRVDLATGERVRAAELLRRKLDRSRDADGNFEIRLNTFVLDKTEGLFFLGPEYRNDGSVLSAGKYLDKIDWIKFKVVTSQAPAVKTANLKYGGTCYIRTRVPPCGDPAKPLALAGEFRVFPFRYFLTLDNGVNWEGRPRQEDTVKLVFGPNPGEPDAGVLNSTYENRFLRERSVAATDWVLTISRNALDLALLEDIELHVRHLSVSRVVPNCN